MLWTAEGGLTDLRDVAIRWLDHDGAKRLVILDDLTVIWQSSGFRAFADRAAAFGVTDHRLIVAGPIEAKIVGFIASTHHARRCTILPDFENGADLLIWGFRMVTGRNDVICLDFGFDHDPNDLCQDVVRDRFQLTPAELRVLEKLLAGDRPAAIAKESRVSVETIRSHVRSIYDKTQVRSRDKLFELMNRYRAR